MELREYLVVRRSHNLIRQKLVSKERLTFLELAILCRMHLLKRPMNTSEIADYQDALRPTMTHRTKHLSSLGYISRQKGEQDRRNVSCAITDEGVAYVAKVCKEMGSLIRKEGALERATQRRVECYVEAMGALTCMSSDLVLLAILDRRRGAAHLSPASVSELVATLGLLQPTVSMSLAALEKEGMVARDGDLHTSKVQLTEAGAERAEEMCAQIEAIIPRR